MGSCCTADAPTPPNPYQTASAQTGTNVSTALANSYLNNVNQQTPQGSLTNEVTGNYSFTDPTSGATYQIPRWTSTQTLNPTGQATFDQNQQAQLNMAGMANQQSGQLKNLLGTPFDADAGAPGAAPMDWLHSVGFASGYTDPTNAYQTGYASGGDITRDFSAGGDITRSYGPQDNYSADRQRIEQSMFERVNPQLQQDEQRLRQQLADQGIRYGSQAYQGAYDPYNRQVTDTRLGIVAAGGQEQQRMDQMAAQQAAFRNAAQQQGYAQNQGRAAFQNQAQQQAEGQNAARGAFWNQAAESQFNQAMGRTGLYNQAQAQNLGRNQSVFNAQNQSRNQYLQEAYQQRTQPINEITALLSGSQVSQPNFINANKTQIPTTDVAGLINQNFAQQNDIYKTDQAFWGDIIGGGLGAAGKVGAAYASDVRVKENIAPMGSIMSPKGELPIYAYDYKDDFDDGKRHVGPMAQDVEKIAPDAVKTIDGVKHIKRDKLGSIFGSRG
jgi:hypothetical protein